MRRRVRLSARNQLDLSDLVQVRTIKRRLRVSEPELTALVARVGNSIAAINKEIGLRRKAEVATATEVPSAAVIDATQRQTGEIASESPVDA